MHKLKVMTILGTRPEIIRLSRVLAALEHYTDHVLVHTGQNYDFELNQIFFDELGVRKPNHFLDIDTSTLGSVLAGILHGTESVILEEKPDAVLVLGDTNSAIATIMAKRMKIPTYHMEAGNRSFDANVPEEINRKIVDHTADFNLVYTEHARRHLLSEGLSHRFIYLSGSPMREVLEHGREQINRSTILDQLQIKRNAYFIVSIHREENVDNKNNLRDIVNSLVAVSENYRLPIILTTHPRTRARLKEQSMSIIRNHDIRTLNPFGFFDYNNLQQNAYCVLSDSGTISEESAILNFPAITMRNAIERPEAIDTGSIMISGLIPEEVLSAINLVTTDKQMFPSREIPQEYNITNTSQRVVKLIMGTAKRAHQWLNMDEFSRYDWGSN